MVNINPYVKIETPNSESIVVTSIKYFRTASCEQKKLPNIHWEIVRSELKYLDIKPILPKKLSSTPLSKAKALYEEPRSEKTYTKRNTKREREITNNTEKAFFRFRNMKEKVRIARKTNKPVLLPVSNNEKAHKTDISECFFNPSLKQSIV